MTTTIIVLLFAIATLAILGVLSYLHAKKAGFTKSVFIALVAGIVLGLSLQLVLGAENPALITFLDWLNIIGSGYVSLLKMLIIPLVFISLVSAFTKLEIDQNIKKIAGTTLTILLGTTAIASLIGYLSVIIFNLQGASFTGNATKDALASIQEHQDELTGLTLPQQIVNFLPTNIVADFAGTRATSTIAVVIFALFVGVAYLSVKKNDLESADLFAKIIKSLQLIINRIVKLVLSLTPYGVFALITKASASNSLETIMRLGVFLLAGYLALLAVLLVHTIILVINRINPVTYYKKAWPALIFAFSSRTSAGTLPLNVKIQTESLGVAPTIANFSASFGLTIGQNGCAGVYPSMIATIIAPTVGIDVFSWQFLVTLIAIDVIASFGVAGVGGGALFTALIVLGSLNLPVATLGVLIAVDPIIDMGRTLVNVNDSILAGIITAKRTGQLDQELLNDDKAIVASTL